METIKFDNFLNYILNINFTKQTIHGNNNSLYTDSLIEMMYEIHNNYVRVKDELIGLKPTVENDSKDIFNAEIDRLLNKLEKLQFDSNYEISKIKHWLSEYGITKSILFSWHDVIPENNDLYLILDTHISWVEMEPDPNIYPFLNRIDSYDAQEIHRIFESFIKDHYVNKTIALLEKQKFSIQNGNPYPDIFKNHNTFEFFTNYIKLHIIEPHLDYSYLFQRLLNDNLINNMEHRSFMEWLKKEEFIKPQTYQKLIEKNQFYTLDKSETSNRMNNFNNVFNI